MNCMERCLGCGQCKEAEPCLVCGTSKSEVRYRNCSITYNPKPIPDRSCDYDYCSDDVDAEWDGDGYRLTDGICGTGSSVQDCKDQIDEELAELKGIETVKPWGQKPEGWIE